MNLVVDGQNAGGILAIGVNQVHSKKYLKAQIHASEHSEAIRAFGQTAPATPCDCSIH